MDNELERDTTTISCRKIAADHDEQALPGGSCLEASVRLGVSACTLWPSELIPTSDNETSKDIYGKRDHQLGSGQGRYN